MAHDHTDPHAIALAERGPDAGAGLDDEARETLRGFLKRHDVIGRGGVMTDLDGTAVLERDGRILIPDAVSQPLTRLNRRGCRVALNTLRFPLNVIKTFGREWHAISGAPLPLVSLNGGVIGRLIELRDGSIAFEESVAFPLEAGEIEEVLVGIEGLLSGGVEDIALFHYPRDWTKGERIWTPSSAQVEPLRMRYRSASEVHASDLQGLREVLHAEPVCMLMPLVNADENKLMAYQLAKRSHFITHVGVDKASGAAALAHLMGGDLAHMIGAGDTPVDTFMGSVGLAVHVGGRDLEHKGLAATIKVPDSLGLGALFTAAADQLDGG